MVLWDQCLQTLRDDLPDNTYTMWINPLEAEMDGDILVLYVPNDYFHKLIKTTYYNQIKTVVMQHSNKQVSDVVVKVRQQTLPLDSQSEPESAGEHNVDPVQKKAQIERQNLSHLDPKFTYDLFVKGKSNEMAFNAMSAVIEELGNRQHNPFFLYGATGLGKTHLMHAAGHYLQKQGKEVFYMTSDTFVQQFVTALRLKEINAFKAVCRRPDLLMIDDIHVLGRKAESSKEFLTLFNDLLNNNKQIILASDKHPSTLSDIDERLKSRFSWGLSIALDPPNLTTRIQILQKKAEDAGAVLPKDCALFIAQNIIANVRELEGTLNKVLAVARFRNLPIDLTLTKRSMQEIVALRAQTVNVDNIQRVVAEYYEVSYKDILSKKRARTIVRPRQMAMLLARELTGESYPEIGKAFGGRDHSTVMHACDKITELKMENKGIEHDYRTLCNMLSS